MAKRILKTGLAAICLFLLLLVGMVITASTVIGNPYTTDHGFVNYDWKLETTDHIGTYDRTSPDHEFVLATVYLQNYSTDVDVAPTPDGWDLVADNVTYSPDYVRSMDDSLGYTDMPIPYGGDAKAKVVYNVPITVKSGYIKHNGPFTYEPTFRQINYYNHTSF